MEYKNNWPEYIQEKVKPVKGVTETVVSTADTCTGGKSEGVYGYVSYVAYLAEVDEVRKKKMSMRQLPLDDILKQLIVFQASKDRAFSCRAKKASIELALERKRLSKCKVNLTYEVRRGRMTREAVEAKMRIENRKAISLFLSRWSSLFEVVR